MLDGRVTVNGVTVSELGSKADPVHDDIRVDGRRVKPVEVHRYVLLNKPRGYVSTRSDPERRPTVIDLLVGVREYVYPVGRLDFDSEGLLLLTNDGELAAQLTHPRQGVPRVYEVRILGVPDEHDLDRLRRGLVIEGRRTAPADVRLLNATPHTSAKVSRGRGRLAREEAPSSRHPRRSAEDRSPRASRADENAVLLITISEGRNREVR